MGYSMVQGETSFMLRKEHHVDAFTAMKKLCDRRDSMTGEAWGAGQLRSQWFAFTDLREMRSCTDLGSILHAWRWRVRYDADGNINDVQFAGENLGDDEHLWTMLAPFVEPGSYISMQGEDGHAWTWRFNGYSPVLVT